MKKIRLGKSEIFSSQLALGCMRINEMSIDAVEELIDTAIEQGITMFEHADIYGKWENGQVSPDSEILFGKVLEKRPELREKIQIQTKCGIIPGHYDLSKEHILEAVNGSLERLKTDYVDLLVLHRPDTLMEPEEIAEAFDILEKDGKVRNFGVSNFNVMQFKMLQRAVKQPLIVNQLQFGIGYTALVDSGIQANTNFEGSSIKDGSFLEYSRINEITIQPWSPLQVGWFEGVFIDHPDYKELNEVLGRIANEQNTNKGAVAIAWILRHPANMQVVLGTTKPNRLIETCEACKIELTRKEWYEIYAAAGHTIP